MTDENPGSTEWVKKAELAKHFGFSTRYVELLMKRRILPYRKTGTKCVRFNIPACEQALARFDVVSKI